VVSLAHFSHFLHGAAWATPAASTNAAAQTKASRDFTGVLLAISFGFFSPRIPPLWEARIDRWFLFATRWDNTFYRAPLYASRSDTTIRFPAPLSLFGLEPGR